MDQYFDDSYWRDVDDGAQYWDDPDHFTMISLATDEVAKGWRMRHDIDVDLDFWVAYGLMKRLKEI